MLHAGYAGALEVATRVASRCSSHRYNSQHRRESCTARTFHPASHLPSGAPEMKTEADVLDVVRRVYAAIGEGAELVRVKPHYGGWLNTLQYDVVRADGAVATIRRKHVDEGNCDALAAELSTFAAPGARQRLCRQCGKWMPESAHYCQACGNRLEHASGPVPPILNARAATRRAPARTTFVATAIICALATAAYALIRTDTAPDSALIQVPVAPKGIPEAASEGSPLNPRPSPPTESRRDAVGIGSVEPTSNEPKENLTAAPRNTAAPAVAAASAPRQSPPSKTASQRSRAHLSSAAAQKRTAVRHNSIRTERHSIDGAFRRISVAECSAGFAGALCREKLRFKLCNGRWTEHHVPGQSACHVVAHADRGF